MSLSNIVIYYQIIIKNILLYDIYGYEPKNVRNLLNSHNVSKQGLFVLLKVVFRINCLFDAKASSESQIIQIMLRNNAVIVFIVTQTRLCCSLVDGLV